MYKVIGTDEKEYGPVSAEVLKQWIADNRVNAQTRVLPEGATEWKLLGEIPELAIALPRTPPPQAPTVVIRVSTESAASLVKGPAIALIVTASLGILYYLFSGVVALAGGGMFKQEIPTTIPPEFRAFFEGMRGPVAGLVSLGIAALDAFVLFGSIKMLRLQSYGLAMAACIAALLPCQCCCLLGLPFGIWGLVVLNKPEVKAGFNLIT